MNNIKELLRQYFFSKTKQLVAASEEAICEHAGLKGSHREDLIKLYFNDILPRRFEVGRGMVYGMFHKSREADIVIWDSYNYPKIQLQGHSLFFAESVKIVFEVKTVFNTDTLEDILRKSESVRNIVPMGGLNLEDDIIMMKQQIDSILTGDKFEGILKASPHIATGAVAFRGGQDFSLSKLSQNIIDNVDDNWPDILILLEAGKVIVKQYEEDGVNAFLELFEAGDDALLLFTSSLLGLLSSRVVNIEDSFYLSRYASLESDDIKSERLPFRITRWVPGRTVI